MTSASRNGSDSTVAISSQRKGRKNRSTPSGRHSQPIGVIVILSYSDAARSLRGSHLVVVMRPFDFAVVGVPKAGTTSLVDYLRVHADIFLPLQKEVPFFIYDEPFAAGEKYLAPFYAGSSASRLVGI